MAQAGDTVTYGFVREDAPVAEDVSSVKKAVVDYCDGPGGESNTGTGGSGGRVENAEINVEEEDTLYIFVGGISFAKSNSTSGRYSANVGGGGSSEVTLFNTDETDSSDEPFLVGAGGGGQGATEGAYSVTAGRPGARISDNAPPLGGAGGTSNNLDGGDAKGAIDDQNRGLVSGGTTITGGGAGADTDGEIQITYKGELDSDSSKSRGRRSRLFR